MNKVLTDIRNKTIKNNRDNISRTKAYEAFYTKHPEIRWALLAGVVSRNAGWNMTDLESIWYKQLVEQDVRATILAMYERANWIIFNDAYPQLLLYEYVKKHNLSNFDLLKIFNVSSFMQKEWKIFIDERDELRLCTALIINEQNLLESEVMSHPMYKKAIFYTARYQLEEHVHFSYVLLPTLKGSLYGQYVRRFTNVNARIELGKRLAMILFHPSVHHQIIDFLRKTEPTGSRRDYELVCQIASQNTSPILRWVYPVFRHHPSKGDDWSNRKKVDKQLFTSVNETEPKDIRRWVHKKRVELYWCYYVATSLHI